MARKNSKNASAKAEKVGKKTTSRSRSSRAVKKDKSEATPDPVEYIPGKTNKNTGLVPADPLSRYLDAVRSIRRLDPDEEHNLLLKVKKENDQEAALRLVTANLWLVVSIAFEFRSQFQNILDLIQEGNIGLMRAIQKFDPFKGVRLPAYASYWVRAYILKYILNNWRLVRVGTTNVRRKLLFNLNKVMREMTAAGIEPSPKLLAEHFSTTQENVVAVQKSLTSSDVSLETPVADGSTLTLAETLHNSAPHMDETLGESEIMERFKKEVAEFSKTLKDSDKMILFSRLLSDDPLTLATIGERFGVSREAMRQAEERLMARLKKHLEEKVPGIKDFGFTPKKGG
ncbi:MAG: sigma-70 family RNA polymerase sigma factor [Nitrospinae bacterium]|nr:sigma-70 family RNA polymerase sigma factor [Nitrospinota bacterium]